MPKFKIVCVLLAAVLAAVGTVLVLQNMGVEDIPDFEKPTNDPNTYMELTDDVDINDGQTDVREFLFIAHKALLDSKGFYGVSTGSTTAAGIQQNVLNTRYVVGEFGKKNTLKEMVTKGVVSNAYQLFMWGDNYIFRDSKTVHSLDNVSWSNSAQPLAEDVFYSKFGHRSDKLTGYILNWDTVLSGELDSVNNGLYTFRYVLDTNESTTYLRREMITNGSLKSEPTFSKCVIYVTMDEAFNIKSLRTDCAYKANVGVITADCSEDITEVFEPYDGELPEIEFFEEYFDMEGGNFEKEKTALDVLMEIFAPYLNGEDLQVELSARKSGSELFSGLLSISGLDISDLTKLQVAARLGDIDVAYHHTNGAIYLQYQDFKGSTTVNGILGLVDTISQLMGDGVEEASLDSSLLQDFDAEALLANLSFTLYDNDTKCVVNLPVSLAGLNVEANLYADVDGEEYTFTYATVKVDGIELRIEPRAWTVAEINENEYPEILGLADLIEGGKLSLTANVNVTLGDNLYTARADVLVDLATSNLKVTATLNDYGTVTATLVDGVAYVAIGGIKVKLEIGSLNELVEQLQQYVGAFSVEATAVSTKSIFGALSGITATKAGDGRVAFELSLGGVEAALYLKNVDGRWQLDTVVVSADGIYATVAPSNSLGEVTAPSDAASYADVKELIEEFYEPIRSIINAKGYAIGFDGSVNIDGKEYNLRATLTLAGGNVHMIFQLSYDGVSMIKDGELWLIDGRLYLHVDDIKLAVDIGEAQGDNGEFDLDALKQTLEKVKGYRDSIDDVIEMVLSLLDTDFNGIAYDKLVPSMSFENGRLTLTVDGSQLGLGSFKLGLSANDGLNVTLKDFSFKNVTLNVSRASIFAYDGQINAPGENEDFTTNLVIDVQDYPNSTANVANEHNVIYVNIDLLKGVVLARIETTMQGGDKSYLDLKYTFEDNILRLTNGKDLRVLVNINNIQSIVDRINDIVNEFAGAGDEALPDLFGSVGDVDVKAIIKSLSIRSDNGEVFVGLSAMGFDVTAAFQDGLRSITLPVDVIESNLVVKFSGVNSVTYASFPEDSSLYVSIDQVFDDFYYGEDGVESDINGPIYNLVHTNSWKFDFVKDAEIDILNDDGTTTVYQIVAGSFVAFYYNKTDAENFKIRANLTVQKDRSPFIYLDVAFIDGRIYATYSSYKSSKNNELKATVSLSAIQETIDLIPALISVVPQIGTLMDSMSEAMSSMESKLTLGNVSQILNSVSYENRVFTLEINGQAIDANNFGKDPITLQVSEYGDQGLKLDKLSLSYGNVSVNIDDLVVTGSEKNDSGEFVYVEQDILSYFTKRGDIGAHMNFDSIRELLAAFVITADNADENGIRSFEIDGYVNAKLSIVNTTAKLGINIKVDIDKENNVYVAVKITRDASGFASGLIYADDGGYSYVLLNTKEGTISMYRNSRTDYTYCSLCKNWTCTSTILHAAWRKSYSYLDTEAPVGDKLPSFRIVDMPLKEFTAETKTMVGYILDVINFGSVIDNQIRKAFDKENTNVYGIEDIFKSYTYDYNAQIEQGTFAIKLDLSPIDSALGEVTANILHVGNFDNVGYDEDGNFSDGNVQLTQINGTAVMISIMNATYELTLVTPTTGLAYSYVVNNNYLW